MDNDRKPIWDVPPAAPGDIAQSAGQLATAVATFYRGLIAHGLERDEAREMARAFLVACLGNLGGRGGSRDA